MKTINRKSLLLAGICALALSLGSTVFAEKGAEALVGLPKAPPTKIVAAVPAPHMCANCTDTLVNVVDKATKGPNHLVTKVAQHNCPGCSTKISIEGTGKAKRDVAIHSCNAEVKPICCVKN
jgi:hypothetical protein